LKRFFLSQQKKMEDYWKEYVDYIKNRGNIDELMIISSDDGGLWASSDADSFFLKQYKATIMQEDGTEKEETVNEAVNIVKFMKDEKPSQGLRINGGRKHQITRSFKDEQTGLHVVFSKIPNGGACIANAGKCTLIGTFSEAKNHSSPECNETIQQMAMYLNKSSWPDKDDLPGGGGGGSGGGAVDAGSVNWQTHVDKALVGRGNIADAMIIAADTLEILASTADFKVMKQKFGSMFIFLLILIIFLFSYKHIKRTFLKRMAPIEQKQSMNRRISKQ
jgi:hypothetical protein